MHGRYLISFFTACVLSVALGVFAANAETARPSFDCAKASTKVEKAICSDEELAKQDVRLNEVYGELLPLLPANEKAKLKDEQRSWVKHRENFINEWCTKSENIKAWEENIKRCINTDTRDRIAEFEDMIDWINNVPPVIWQRGQRSEDETGLRYTMELHNWPRGRHAVWTIEVPKEETSPAMRDIVASYAAYAGGTAAGLADRFYGVNRNNYKEELYFFIRGQQKFQGISPKDGTPCSLWSFVKSFSKSEHDKSYLYEMFFMTDKGKILDSSLAVFDWKLFTCNEKESKEEGWIIWSAGGAGGYGIPEKSLSLKPQRSVLDNYAHNITQIYGKSLGKMMESKGVTAPEFDTEVTSVGTWNGHEVYKVYEKNYGISQFVLKLGDENYKIFFFLGFDDTPIVPRISIKPSKYEDKLTVGYYAYGVYWKEEFIFHPKTKLPILLPEMLPTQ